ncbi:MAG: hypothetical protein ABIU96_04100 [Rhodanobacter sp.]
MTTNHRRRDSDTTEATIRATGTFWCTASNHHTTGKITLVNGRRVCAACNIARKARLAMLKEIRHGHV